MSEIQINVNAPEEKDNYIHEFGYTQLDVLDEITSGSGKQWIKCLGEASTTDGLKPVIMLDAAEVSVCNNKNIALKVLMNNKTVALGKVKGGEKGFLNDKLAYARTKKGLQVKAK